MHIHAVAWGLDNIPFDVFYKIAAFLDDRDYVNLGKTNKAIHASTKNRLLAKQIMKNSFQFGREEHSAFTGEANYDYYKAVQHRFAVHDAIATADPYSVCALAYGTNFLYHRGFLCYCVGPEIRLLDVHSAAHQERVLNWRNMFLHLHTSLAGEDTAHIVELLRFADDIVVLRARAPGAQDDVLLAVDIAQCTQEPGSRLLFQKAVPASSSVFVRHSRSYIWYGVFTADGGANGICSICGVDIALSTEPIQFTVHCAQGGGLGESLCFEVYKDHLYAVSTLATSENEERYFAYGRDGNEEFSSFYQWSCYVPSGSGRNWSGRLWRREHREGPINEAWADLSIRMDETTGRLVIVECRREWPGGKSENRRTCYFQQLPSLEALDAQDVEDLASSAWGDVCQGNFMTSQIPYHERPSKRLRRNYHTEFEPGHVPTQRKEFIPARTKYRTYYLSASTFVDLVSDPDVPESGVRTQDHLRLRVVSRKRKCPIDAEGVDGPAGFLFEPTQHNPGGIPVEHSEEQFLSGDVHMWPPENAPSKLTRLLCPDVRIDGFNAIADERSLIYSIQCPGLPIGQQILILISFDPKIHFSTMKPLGASQSPVLPEQIFPVQVPLSTSADFSMIQQSNPLYEAINWGYWLR